jgi:ATP-dependent DNA ligase
LQSRDIGHRRTAKASAYGCTEAALGNGHSSLVIVGEAVPIGVDGISDFNGLHSRRHDDEIQLYAFDIQVVSGRRAP